MSAAKQISAVVGMNTRALHTRAAASLVVVVGMAAVVAVALSIFSMAAGITESGKKNSAPDHMMILSQGADNEGGSNIPRDALPTIADTPGLRKGPDGKPLLSAEVNANFQARKRVNGVETFVNVRGVQPNVFDVKPDLKLSEGRMFKPGLHELIVGKTADSRFRDIGIGTKIRLQDGPWEVVGMYESATNVGDYGLMGDADTLMASTRRNAYNIVVARLENGTKSAQDGFAAAIKSNPALSLGAETSESYRSRQIVGQIKFYQFLAYGVGAIMGLGAMFSALNTMYAAVSTRITEIATLRAIGFGSTPVVMSIFAEAFSLAVVGAGGGALIAWIAFNGHRQEMGFYSVQQAVTPIMMATGIGLSLLIGAIGALFPAIRAARLPVTVALQAR